MTAQQHQPRQTAHLHLLPRQTAIAPYQRNKQATTPILPQIMRHHQVLVLLPQPTYQDDHLSTQVFPINNTATQISLLEDTITQVSPVKDIITQVSPAEDTTTQMNQKPQLSFHNT